MPSVELTRKLDYSDDGTYRLRIYVSETSDNITPYLLLYRTYPRDHEELTAPSGYLRPVRYYELFSFPSDSPGDDSPFYRQSYLDLQLDSMHDVNQIYTTLTEGLTDFLRDLEETNNTAPTTETYTI